MAEGIQKYEFIIIGAGLAGATLFASLSTIAPTLLLEKRSASDEFRAARIITAHSHQFILENTKEWSKNPKINLRPCNAVCYSSRNQNAPIFGHKEFGQNFGYIIDELEYIRWHIAYGQSNHGLVLWDREVTEIGGSEILHSSSTSKNSRKVKVSKVSSSGPDNQFQGKMIILATGSSNIQLLHQSGFSLPDELNMLSATFYGTPDVIDSNFEWDYIYHLHPKMSTKGPLNINRGLDFFNLNYVSDKKYSEMEDILNRVLLNYKPIQNFFRNIKNPPTKNTSPKFRKLKVWKHPTNTILKDNILLVGETTGMVTDCYYEGSLSVLASVNIAYNLLKNIYSSNQNYNSQNLAVYDKTLRSTILGNFEKSQQASQDMFLTDDKNQPQIWDAYLTAINKFKQVRKNIHFAWVNDNISAYPLEHDEFCGEKIYSSLPLSLRVGLAPYFLKLKFFK